MLRPKPIDVKPLDDYKLLLLFDSGEKKLFDVKERLNHIFFAPLRDENVFKTAHVNGITVEWTGDIDICPDELYYNSTNIE